MTNRLLLIDWDSQLRLTETPSHFRINSEPVFQYTHNIESEIRSGPLDFGVKLRNVLDEPNFKWDLQEFVENNPGLADQVEGAFHWDPVIDVEEAVCGDMGGLYQNEKFLKLTSSTYFLSYLLMNPHYQDQFIPPTSEEEEEEGDSSPEIDSREESSIQTSPHTNLLRRNLHSFLPSLFSSTNNQEEVSQAIPTTSPFGDNSELFGTLFNFLVRPVPFVSQAIQKFRNRYFDGNKMIGIQLKILSTKKSLSNDDNNNGGGNSQNDDDEYSSGKKNVKKMSILQQKTFLEMARTVCLFLLLLLLMILLICFNRQVLH